MGRSSFLFVGATSPRARQILQNERIRRALPGNGGVWPVPGVDDGIVAEMPFTYILRCADDTLYVGHTEALASREQIHNDGKGAKHSAARRPVRMVYAEEHASIESAIARERQLKRWS